MSSRTTLCVTMKLLSDTIFGSGFSVPGGEDIAVCEDEAGYPYLKGSTLKGLLRESLENWLVWTGGNPDATDELLGASGWSGTADGRRIQLTPLTLADRPQEAEKCYGLRTFTSLENGTVKEGTLRMAACIRAGLEFSGSLTCAKEDVELVSSALQGIKWAGTMRSRGFGRVSFRCKEAAEQTKKTSVKNACCIHYRLRTETPVLITDLSRSRGNSYETRGYIPGSAIRGMVVSALASHSPDWFAAHKGELLSDRTRFLDAVPVVGELPPLPSVKGFYENKEETHFETVVKNGEFTPGLKRAKLGTFCALDGDTVRYWSAKTDGVTRIKRGGNGEETQPFQTRYLSAGQEFEGYISLEDPDLSEKISSVFPKTVWLGADRYEGFGQCTVQILEAVDAPAWIAQYGPKNQEQIGTTLYLLAVSPLTMQNELGEPCGIDERQLAKALSVAQASVTFCSTSMSEYGGYNRTWKSRAPAVRMYDRGSIFQIVCNEPPKLECIRSLEKEGFGIRRAEGYGQVLFLCQERFESLIRKESAQKGTERKERCPGVMLRQERYQWIMRESKNIVKMKLSRSQLGSIQALCEKTMATGGGTRELYAVLDKNLIGRGAKHGSRFTEIDRLIRETLEKPVPETLGVPCADSMEERFQLLCAVFDHSRKVKSGEGKDV